MENTTIEKSVAKPETAIGFVVGGVEVFVDMAGLVDVEKEKIRLQGELDQVNKYLIGLESKLANAEFVQNAPAAVVEKEQQKLVETKDKKEKLEKQLQQLK